MIISGAGAGGGYTKGGAGGGTTGNMGDGSGGNPGTQSAGGTGTYGADGSALQGGNGDSRGSRLSSTAYDGGGGGAGYYGGEGGYSDAGAGGGGSGFIKADIVVGTSTLTTGNNGTTAIANPPNYNDPDYISGVGVGNKGAVNGGNGLVVISYTPVLNMEYASSTTETTTTTNVAPSSSNNEIVRLKVVTTGALNPLSVSSITFATTGSTSVADISNARVYYTTSTTISNDVQFGTTHATPNGNIIFTGTQTLSSGDNYFWLVYDIASDATIGDVVDGACNSVTVASTNYTPSVQEPTGSRTINNNTLYSGGDGTVYNPYQIANKTDLKYLSEHDDDWSLHFIQTANIIFSDSDFQVGGDFYNDGEGFIPIGNSTTKFTGSYDGDEFSISNLYILQSTYPGSYLALFGYTVGATITDIYFTNSDISGTYYYSSYMGDGGSMYIGGIIGRAEGTTISGCYASGNVVGYECIGSIVGSVESSTTVTNCTSTANVIFNPSSSYAKKGGVLIGMLDDGCTLSNSSADGELSGASIGYNCGGLVGYCTGTIEECFALGSIEGVSAVGGLVGSLNPPGTITECYANANVVGNERTGGLLGYTYIGYSSSLTTISNCYSIGDVTRISGSTSEYIGSFCGFIFNRNGGSCTIENSYSIGDVVYTNATNPTGKGFVGHENATGNTYTSNYFDSDVSNQSTATGAASKSTTQMQTQSTFTGWDFTTSTGVWEIVANENNGYPFLQWQDFFATPTTQATNIIFSNVNSTQLDIDWTAGNGTKRVVFAKQANTGTIAPLNNTIYTASSTFGYGTEIGTEWYCVYNGNGTSTNVSGLTENTEYIFQVLEYNGNPGNINYLTTTSTNNPNTQTTNQGNIIWDGSTSNAWNTSSNWNNDIVPTSSYNVIIPDVSSSGGQSPVIDVNTEASCSNLTVDNGGDLTIQSNASGTGSLIVSGTITCNNTITAQRYISPQQWHGISSPVDNATANSLYPGAGNPYTYLKYHTESTNTYTNITSLNTDLGDMKGWMMWYDGTSGMTFDITGDLRSGTIGSANNLSRTADGNDNGWNFVGNPYTSAIDWEASAGWTKTNIGSSIYLYNDGNWATWNGTEGTNGGSRYIASGQGFFVEVIDGQNDGTLTMTNDVQVHNTTNFLKNQSSISELLRLEVTNGTYSDETLIYFNDEATYGYDYNLDAHKLFSFNENIPQIYSTQNDFMSINVLPIVNTEIPIDVRGKDNEIMTISATEILGFSDILMLDNYNGIITNLSENDYEFTYNNNFNDRFILFFTTVGEEEKIDEIVNIYSFDKKVRVIIPEISNTKITVYNIYGRLVTSTQSSNKIIDIPVMTTGHYIVKVNYNNNIVTNKVIIR